MAMLGFSQVTDTPRGFRGTLEKLPMLRDVMAMKLLIVKRQRFKSRLGGFQREVQHPQAIENRLDSHLT